MGDIKMVTIPEQRYWTIVEQAQAAIFSELDLRSKVGYAREAMEKGNCLGAQRILSK
jgi:hypothetical protein